MKATSSMHHRTPGKEQCRYQEMNEESPCGALLTKYEYTITETHAGRQVVRTGTCSSGHCTTRAHGPDVKYRASTAFNPVAPGEKDKE